MGDFPTPVLPITPYTFFGVLRIWQHL